MVWSCVNLHSLQSPAGGSRLITNQKFMRKWHRFSLDLWLYTWFLTSLWSQSSNNIMFIFYNCGHMREKKALKQSICFICFSWCCIYSTTNFSSLYWRLLLKSCPPHWTWYKPLVARGKCVLSERLAVILLAVAGKCSCKEDATPKPPSDGFGC